MLPLVITSIVQASVSIKRLGSYLQYEELDRDNLVIREQAAVGMLTMLLLFLLLLLLLLLVNMQ